MLPWLSLSAQTVPEYDLKAAFVYNFALFTDWPADTLHEGDTLNFCVHSSSALRQPLSSLAERSIKGRRLVVRNPVAQDGLRACHVLFIGVGDRERWSQIRKGLAGASVLTISDDEEAGHDGILIALAMDGNRIVFDIDTRAARQAKLVFSSKLLRLARSVQ